MKNNYENNLKAALRFVAKSVIRPTLQGVLHTMDGEMIATDANRLIVIQEAHNGEHAGEIIEKDGRVIEGKYPDVNRIIPRSSKYEFKININEWLETHTALKKEIKVSNDEPLTIRLICSEQSPVTFQGIHKGFLEDEKSIGECVGFDFKIAYNVNYMLDALRALKSLGYKQCTIGLNEDKQPIHITAKQGNKTMVNIVVMPIKLNQQPRKKIADDIIEIGDRVEFKDKGNKVCAAEVKKINTKYYIIEMEGKEYKVAKSICKKFIGAF